MMGKVHTPALEQKNHVLIFFSIGIGVGVVGGITLSLSSAHPLMPLWLPAFILCSYLIWKAFVKATMEKEMGAKISDCRTLPSDTFLAFLSFAGAVALSVFAVYGEFVNIPLIGIFAVPFLIYSIYRYNKVRKNHRRIAELMKNEPHNAQIIQVHSEIVHRRKQYWLDVEYTDNSHITHHATSERFRLRLDDLYESNIYAKAYVNSNDPDDYWIYAGYRK